MTTVPGDGARVPRRRPQTALAVTAVLWVALIVATPVLRQGVSASARTVGALVQMSAAVLCHQQPTRSFAVRGMPLPVCARCLGLYGGGALGLLGWRNRRRAASPAALRRLRQTMVVAAAPTALSVLVVWSGGPDTPNAWRAAMGLLLGGAAGMTLGAAAGGEFDAEVVR